MSIYIYLMQIPYKLQQILSSQFLKHLFNLNYKLITKKKNIMLQYNLNYKLA